MRVPTPQTLYFALTHLLPSNWTGPQACKAASSLQITLRTCALGFPSGVSWVAGNYVTCMYLGERRMWVWSGMKTLSRVVQSLRNLCRPPRPSPVTQQFWSLEPHLQYRTTQVCRDRCGHGRRTVLSPDLKAEKLEQLGAAWRGEVTSPSGKGNSGLGREGGAEARKQSLCGAEIPKNSLGP